MIMSMGLKKRMSRLLSLVLALSICAAALPAFSLAEETEEEYEVERELTEEEAEGMEGDDTEAVITGGKIYEEKTKEDFDLNSPALYTGRMRNYSIYAEKFNTAEEARSIKKLFTGMDGKTVDILYVGLVFFIVRYKDQIGYTKRQYMVKESIIPVDPVHTAPFNVQKHTYIATVAKECYVRKTMSKEPLVESEFSTYWVLLHPGTRISIWQFVDGWAVVNYMRNYGYIDPNDLTDLIPVSPTEEAISEESPIAAYTSYYTMKHLYPSTPKDLKEMNENRVWNIGHGCERIRETGLMQPGDVFDGNKKNIGPYREYKLAIGLVDGRAVLSSGGGTCQVSSTLYNALCQLPGLTVLQRRPHGGEGASYLPIHCDAAVGNSSLNLRFRNDYDFPIRLEAYSSGDGALLMLAYRAD